MSQTMAPPPIGWFPDPVHRHEYRYFDGTTWTDLVADHGITARDPLPAAPAPAASAGPTALPAEGTFHSRWIDLRQVVMPRVCCACGASGAFDELKVGGSDWTGKLSATVGVPLCSSCAEVLRAGGVKPGHAVGGLLQSSHVPTALKPQFKHVAHAASFSLKRQGFGIAIRFVFHNADFAAAFEAANPKR